ncbi:MAG: hypothetical protein ACRENE_05775 [Polyangiaceae bacterium]
MRIPLVKGEDLLTKPRKILNLWSETGDCHLGHLHMMRTAGELIAKGHKVVFYVGEFKSSLWPTAEFHRMTEQCRAVEQLLGAVITGANAESGWGLPDADVAPSRTKYTTFLTKLASAATKTEREGLVPPPVSDDMLRIWDKSTWGGAGSPFFVLVALYAKTRALDSLLIAERHEYIGRVAAWISQNWFSHPLELMVVSDFPAIVPNKNGEKFMASSNGAIRMQEPKEYLEQRLKKAPGADRSAFIEQCCRLLLQRSLAVDEFKTWWAGNQASYTAADAAEFMRAMERLFQEYRGIAHSVIPVTSQHTFKPINNEFLLKYVGLTAHQWSKDHKTPQVAEGFLQSLPNDINEEADKHEHNVYEPAFNAIGAAIKSRPRPDLGFSSEVLRDLCDLTAYNKTTDLLLYFGARKVHRDHYVHTFNVGALGQFVLDLYVGGQQLKQHIATKLNADPIEVEFAWWLTAMLHDHAYPLYSVLVWMERLKPLADVYANERDTMKTLALAHLDSLRVVHKDIRSGLRKIIESGSFNLAEFWSDTKATRREIFSFLKQEDQDFLLENPAVDHGYAAVLNMGFWLKPHDRVVRKKELIEQIFRGILYHTSVDLAGKRPAMIHWGDDPLAYLLLVCDELQEWSRRSLREREGVLRATPSELLVAPLSRRLDRQESWQVPTTPFLDVTVRYTRRSEMGDWTSHKFHEDKSKMFRRLQASSGDPFPKLRLAYALTTDVFPA